MRKMIAAALFLALAIAPAVLAHNHVDGKWEATVETPRGAQDITFDFIEADGHLTGTVSTRRGESEIEEGTVNGNDIAFKQTVSFQDREFVLSYSGTVDGDEIAFTREVEGRDRTSDFTATRVK